MKGKRQKKILELIEKYDIETQEELTRRLQEEGFPSTQGTISRDIRELKLTKVAGESGKQKYAPILTRDLHVSDKYRRVLSEAIIHMEGAGNLLVIKTVSGMAMAVAAAVDALKWNEVVGCIAGDDTIMCAIRTTEDTAAVMEKIRKIVSKGI